MRKGLGLVAFIACAAVATTVFAAANFFTIPALDKYLTADNIAKIEAGEIVKDTVLKEDAAKGDSGRGIGLVYIKAEPSKVLAAIEDFSTYTAWMPNVKKAQVVNKAAHRVDVEFELGILGNTIKYTTIHEVNEAEGKIRWRLDDAKPKENVADSVGAWVLKPHKEGTIVAYIIDVDTGMSVPKIIQSWLTNKSLKSVLAALKERVEGK